MPREAVQQALKDQPDAKLMVFGMKYGTRGRAGIVVGDPDTADHIGAAAPGLSYGSLTTGLALQQLPPGVVGSAVFYGSPGLELDSVERLHVPPHQTFSMQTSADQIAAPTPGLAWKWHLSWASGSCTGNARSDTRAKTIQVGEALFDGPIQDEVWPQAFDVMRQKAASLGAATLHGVVDQPGYHNVDFLGSDELRITLTTTTNALLEAATPCRLMEDWHTEHHLPVPTPTTS